MAQINLGRIKGDKGDTGAKGDRGDTGAKGEKGDKGDKGDPGTDGCTPVFSVQSTTTLSSGQSARVEVDATDPGYPQLRFYIPRGRDGADAIGDMVGAVYDTSQRETDIFEYTDNAVNSCMKKTGGSFSGTVHSVSGSASDSCVRNIVFSSSLPQTAFEGDICILTEETPRLTLGDASVGQYVGISENGTKSPYIIAAKNYPNEGEVILIRRYVESSANFDRSSKTEYTGSVADILLETCYKNRLETNLWNKLCLFDTGGGCMRHIFLPSVSELSELEYFRSNSSAATNGFSTYKDYWTRTVGSQGDKVYIISSSGSSNFAPPTYNRGLRPAFVLSSETFIIGSSENEYDYEIKKSETGIYVYKSSEWQEAEI